MGRVNDEITGRELKLVHHSYWLSLHARWHPAVPTGCLGTTKG
jgi:hypothetical protein